MEIKLGGQMPKKKTESESIKVTPKVESNWIGTIKDKVIVDVTIVNDDQGNVVMADKKNNVIVWKGTNFNESIYKVGNKLKLQVTIKELEENLEKKATIVKNLVVL